MKRIAGMLLLLLFTGCTGYWSASPLDVIDAILSDPEPEPVCDAESVGVQWEGKVCLKYSDGSYNWRNLYKENEE
jgi:hypothetical protein